jgi:hypothetical protein
MPGKLTLAEAITATDQPGSSPRPTAAPGAFATGSPPSSAMDREPSTSARPTLGSLFGRPAAHVTVDPAEEVGRSSSGGGRPLPTAVQRQMEGAFATSFADVRIHEGPQAERLGADAYTQGSDIHFRPGAYDPHGAAGRELLGHELTHVVQQRAGRVDTPQGKGVPVNEHPALEAEADELGARAARGEAVEVRGASAAPGSQRAVVQRYAIVGFNALDSDRGKRQEKTDENKDDNKDENKNETVSLDEDEKRVLEQGDEGKGYVPRPARGQDALEMFSRQELVHGADPHYAISYARQPPLKVADDGSMAIEHTRTEPRVFFARPDVIAASQARLDDIESSVTLVPDDEAGGLVVPADPRLPLSRANSQRLQAVAPRRRDELAKKLDFGDDLHECSSVAATITAQDVASAGTAVFQGFGNGEQHTTPLTYTGTDDEPSPGRVVEFMAHGDGRDETSGDGEKGKKGKKGEDVEPAAALAAHMHKAPGDQRIDEVDVEKALAEMPKTFRVAYQKKQILPSAVQTLYLVPAAWEEAELRLKKKGDLDYTATKLMCERYRQLPVLRGYAHAARDTTAARNLGVNQFAMPDVGESFGTFSNQWRGVTSKQGQGAVDFGSEKERSRKELDKQLTKNQSKPQELLHDSLPLSTKKLDNFRQHVWSWHFATVVARRGTDSVTLENYNRDTTGIQEVETRWEDLQQTYKKYAKNEAVKAKDAPAAKLRALKEVLEKKQVAFEAAQFEYMRLFGDKGQRWFFQMYGSPLQKDDRGLDQSFHTAWTAAGGFVNPLTLRVSAEAGESFKFRLIEKLRQAVEKRDGWKGNEVLERFFGRAAKAMMETETRAQAAAAYRMALDDLERLK